MKTVKNLSMILAMTMGTVAAGCATDPAAMSGGSDDDGGGDDGGGDGTPAKPALDAAGLYTMQSKFDIVSNVPGKVGLVLNTIIAATDDPDDPTRWVLDQLIGAMPSGTLKTLLNNAKPYVAGFLNDRVLDYAPYYVPIMIEITNNLGQISKNFGLNETLDVSKTATGYDAVVTVVGTHFTIDGTETDHLYADFAMPDTVINGVGVTLEKTGKLGIADHTIPVSYGKVLTIGLDDAIIPMVDSEAHDLGTLMSHLVHCDEIGQAIGGIIGYGGSTFTTACKSGLNKAANMVYSRLAELDGTAMQLGMAGTARGLDKTADGSIDLIQTGAWTGTVRYGSAPVPLAESTFFGARM